MKMEMEIQKKKKINKKYEKGQNVNIWDCENSKYTHSRLRHT